MLRDPGPQAAILDAHEIAWCREVYHTGNRDQSRAAFDTVVRHHEALSAYARAAYEKRRIR